MSVPINPAHRLLLEDNSSFLLLEDNTSKIILDEQIALDDPLDAGTVSTVTPALTFVGEDLPTGGNLTYEVEVDTVNTFTTVNTYYFDGHTSITDVTGDWTNPANAFDGSISTYANALFDGDTLRGIGTTAPSSGGTISMARVRVYNYTSADGIGTASYSSFGTLSTPSGGWTWAILQGLRVDIVYDQPGVGGIPPDINAQVRTGAGVLLGSATRTSVSSTTGQTVNVARVELEVTTAPLIDVTSGLNTGFVDDTTTALADDRLLLEDNVSYLLLEDNSSKLAINYDYPSSDYITYTVPASTLSNGVTYYWRARQKVQNGGSYTSWSEIRNFTVSSGTSITVTQLAATVTASGGTQTIATVNNVSITQVAATITASGGTQLAQTNSSNAQVAATVTAAGGTQAIATVNIVSITQVAATVTASGGTQAIATVNNVAIAQVAGTVTATGGTDTIATVNNIAITQVAGTVTASGGTQVVTAVSNASISQVAATVTATGGTEVVSTVVNASIAQVAGSVTAAGGTQAITTINNVAIAQTAATVTASGGTDTIATVNKVAIAQVAATVTASGGVQSVATSNFVAISQIAATVTATGGTQVIASSNFVAIAQTAATVTASGGTQSIGSVISASVTQVAGVVTASGGTQAVAASSGSTTFKKEVYLLNGNPATRIGTANKRVIMLQNGSFALKVQPNIYLPL